MTITVRKIKFPLLDPRTFNPVWIKDDPTLSYFTLGFSLYNPYIEPFLVQTMRSATSFITDPVLLDDIDGFCRQEAQHYQQHERFNELIRKPGYSGLEDIEGRCKKELQDWMSNESLDFCIGIACGFELYTSKGAVMLLDSGLLESKNVEENFARLFQWHLIEELEHRNVALDVWDQLNNLYPRPIYFNHIGQRHMLGFALECMRLMSRVDVLVYLSSFLFTEQNELKSEGEKTMQPNQ